MDRPGVCVHGCGTETWRRDICGHYCCLNCAWRGAPQDTDIVRQERSNWRLKEDSPGMRIEDLPLSDEGLRHCVKTIADYLGGIPSRWRSTCCSASELACTSKTLHTWFNVRFDSPEIHHRDAIVDVRPPAPAAGGPGVEQFTLIQIAQMWILEGTRCTNCGMTGHLRVTCDWAGPGPPQLRRLLH